MSLALVVLVFLLLGQLLKPSNSKVVTPVSLIIICHSKMDSAVFQMDYLVNYSV